MQLLLFDSLPEVYSGDVLERMMRPRNISEAFRRVKANGGAPGVDGMTVAELGKSLKVLLPRIRQQLLDGSYVPQPVRRVEIPKPGGGMRKLGIPTVMDRLLQQALLQVIEPIFDQGFSENSFGFRQGKSCHQAVRRARNLIQTGHAWVVDLDLEKFFDKVHHDILMERVARQLKDKMALKLIRRYLQAGVMEGGLVSQSVQGTPQGGPLSPLLSNIMLDAMDKELEKRGHKFCRYADDCNIYVRSRRAGERVMERLTNYLAGKLKLTVNKIKSAVDRPSNRQFLGFSFVAGKQARIRMAPDRAKRMKEKVKPLLRRGRGQSLSQCLRVLAPKIRGWAAYFSLCDVKATFERFDEWMRRRLRALLWRQWKRPKTRCRELCKRGLDRERAAKSAFNGRGPWWNAGASHMNNAVPTSYLRKLGYVSILEEVQILKRSK